MFRLRPGLIAALAMLALTSGHAPARAADPVKLDFRGLGHLVRAKCRSWSRWTRATSRDQGIDVTIQVILSSGDRIMALTAGSVAFSNLGRIAAINEMAKGNQSLLLLRQRRRFPRQRGLLGATRVSPRSTDLKGKKVAAKHLGGDQRSNGLLARGLHERPRDIDYVNLPPNEMGGRAFQGRPSMPPACVQPLLDGLKEGGTRGQAAGHRQGQPTPTRNSARWPRPTSSSSPKSLVDEQARAGKPSSRWRVSRARTSATTNPEEGRQDGRALLQDDPPEDTLAGMKSFKYFRPRGLAGAHEAARAADAGTRQLALRDQEDPAAA